jgi:glycosyltransferase involved in cell wall biosynthesis
MSKLAICLLTYNRMDYAKLTIDSIFKHLVVPADWEVSFHIADDGSPEGYVEELRDWVLAAYRDSAFDQEGIIVSISNSERGGYGKNYNLAMQQCHIISKFVMPIEDDWVLARDLVVEDLVRVFNDCPDIGCIRLGYLSYTQELRGTVVASNNAKYLLLDPTSDEPHVFAGHPRIETVEWERLVGPWPEGYSPGETEFRVSTMQARKGIAWPMDLTRSCGDLFQHIGTVRSY